MLYHSYRDALQVYFRRTNRLTSNRHPPLSSRARWRRSSRCSRTILVLLASPSAFSTKDDNLDATGKRITSYPASLMISHNVKPLRHVKTAPILTINNTLLRSMQNTQKVITRLPSSSSFSNLIECDSYLLRFYTYTTGLPSKMVCPRHYQQEKMFLNGHSRQRRSSCLCHAGLSGILWKIFCGKFISLLAIPVNPLMLLT